MINSIEFDKDYEEGYIFQHDIQYRKGRKKSHDCGGYDMVGVDKGYLNKHLINNLIGKKFELSGNKINVFFGPNASGKTTILKTLAAYCMCGTNGMTSLNNFEPLDFGLFNGKYDKEGIESIMLKSAKNKANVDWDGYPVFYANFRPSTTIDDYVGSIVDDGNGSTLNYIFNKNRMSFGQNTIYMINRIVRIMEQMCDFDSFSKGMEESVRSKDRANSVWKECFESTYKYWKGMVTDESSKPTILLDEIDKFLDIINVIGLYTKCLPSVIKKIDCQMVIVTHSPFIMIDSKVMRDTYNIISLDEKYTENVKKELKKIKFA